VRYAEVVAALASSFEQVRDHQQMIRR